MMGDSATPEERIAHVFNQYFSNFDIRIEAEDVVAGVRREIKHEGWWIGLRVLADDGGFPSLEFYAGHRMTDDRHVRIWADGYIERLDTIQSWITYNPEVPGSEAAAKAKRLAHNQRVTDQLQKAGLYPGGHQSLALDHRSKAT